MFLQIKLAENDRDVHRYVWRNMQIDGSPTIYRLTRVAFGFNCSPFLAIATVQNHAERFVLEFPEAAKMVMDDMYVDDCLTGDEGKKEAVKLQEALTELMHRAAHNLTKWSTLGICWNTLTDCIDSHIPQNQFLLHECETKRNMLSDASKIFDPMGLRSPYTARSKMLFQQLWNRGLQWDEQLPDDILQQWNAWKSELPKINEISIPKVTQQNGDVDTYFVMSKTRVAPAKVVSLPRLELLAAMISRRLFKFVAGSLFSTSKEIERRFNRRGIRREALSRGGKSRRLTDSW
ncbi:Hypothetical predicted protein, partial [Paramuricea clavata]